MSENSTELDKAIEEGLNALFDDSDTELESEETTEAVPDEELTPQEETEESQEEAEESQEEGDEGDTETFVVKIGGAEVEKTREELIEGFMLQSDYTRKTQQVAEERKDLAKRAGDQKLASDMLDAYNRDPLGFAKTINQAVGYDPSEGEFRDEPSTQQNTQTDMRISQLEGQLSEQSVRETAHARLNELVDVAKQYPSVYVTAKEAAEAYVESPGRYTSPAHAYKDIAFSREKENSSSPDTGRRDEVRKKVKEQAPTLENKPRSSSSSKVLSEAKADNIDEGISQLYDKMMKDDS